MPVAEQERQANEAEMKLKHRHRLQKRFDRFTVATFGISIDIVAVFVIGVILLAAATVLLLI